MNARNRILILMGILLVVSLCWYLFSTERSTDLQLIGTVDANEVVVSSRIPGRIQTLTVDEGDTVQAGQLIATIQSDDLAAARNAAEATAHSQRFKLQQTQDTERQTQGGTSSQVANAEAQLLAAQVRSGAGPGAIPASGRRQQPHHRPRQTRRHEPAGPR